MIDSLTKTDKLLIFKDRQMKIASRTMGKWKTGPNWTKVLKKAKFHTWIFDQWPRNKIECIKWFLEKIGDMD
jgi:hypothetical protein